MENNEFFDEYKRKNIESQKIDEIAWYLFENKSVQKFKDAREIAIILYNQGINIDMIKSGNFNSKINEAIIVNKCRQNSVAAKDEKRTETLFQVIRRMIMNPQFLRKAIATGLICGFIVVGAHFAFRGGSEAEDLGEDLGQLVLLINGKESKSGSKIIDQHTYEVGRDNNGRPIYAYDQRGIALDIIEVCKTNPALFDVSLHEVYKELKKNRLENMDEILDYLKTNIMNEESLKDLYNQVADCNIFLDYINKLGYIEKDGEKAAFNEYSELASKRGEIGSVFYKMSESNQKVLEKMMNEYTYDSKYKEYIEMIKNTIDSYEPNIGEQKIGGL